MAPGNERPRVLPCRDFRKGEVNPVPHPSSSTAATPPGHRGWTRNRLLAEHVFPWRAASTMIAGCAAGNRNGDESISGAATSPASLRKSPHVLPACCLCSFAGVAAGDGDHLTALVAAKGRYMDLAPETKTDDTDAKRHGVCRPAAVDGSRFQISTTGLPAVAPAVTGCGAAMTSRSLWAMTSSSGRRVRSAVTNGSVVNTSRA